MIASNVNEQTKSVWDLKDKQLNEKIDQL